MTRHTSRTMHLHLAVAVGVADLLAALAVAGSADAVWAAGGSGGGAGRSAVMPAGLQPVASVSGSDVTVRWPTAVLPTGAAVEGYRLNRYDANGQPVGASASCAGTITTTTCVEHNVPSGTWSYSDTPVQLSWSGATSPASVPVTIT